MTQARKTQIDPNATPYYHCINRCVRRAFLCGEDKVSGRCFDHRKQWVVEKLQVLTDVFAIDVCAYAVMSNHYHVVLHIDSARAEAWEAKDVAHRWRRLFKGHRLVQRWLQQASLSEAELMAVNETVELWRRRLMDISWFMRCLNESIARMANEEDDCQGRFWEGRFKSQALLDNTAVLSCMMYVDLNPVRAGIADSLQASDFTSIQQRMTEFAVRQPGRPKGLNPQKAAQQENVQQEALQQQFSQQQAVLSECPILLPFAKMRHSDMKEDVKEDNAAPACIPFAFDDYCELIDWTGRAIRDDKRGAIPDHIQPLLQQLGIKPDHWLDTVSHFESRFPRMMGCLERLQKMARSLDHRWCRGFGAARQCYLDALNSR